MSRSQFALARRRKSGPKVPDEDWADKRDWLVNSCHPAQRDFVCDRGRWVAALVGGRGGKTTGCKARILARMLDTPKARIRYFATSRRHAEDLLWQPLKETLDALEISAEWNETKLRLRFPHNDSTLWLFGCDTKKDAERPRGLPSHECLIDEAGSFDTRLLNYLIDQVITPRLGDYRGTLTLVGTPGLIQGDHRIYQVTKPGSDIAMAWGDPDRSKDWSGWSLHAWSLEDGATHVPEMANAWELALETKRLNGWGDSHPVWRREYLGEWAADNTENVYRYKTDRNQWDPPRRGPFRMAELPEGRDWQYVIGCDLGHGDDFVECIFAFEPHDRVLYQVAEFGAKEMYPKRIAEHLIGEELDPNHPQGMIRFTGWPVGHVADSEGLGQGYLDELRDVYGIPIKAAEKKNKLGAIELFNGDLLDGRIKILKGSKLEIQLQTLQWQIDDHGRLRERRGDRNDYADAALYARREAHHQFGQPEQTPPPMPHTPEHANLMADLAEERLANPSDDEYMSDWGESLDDW